MQAELDSENVAVSLLTVNEAGHESGVPGMAMLGPLPILQDTAAVNAWRLWSVTYRDVVIVDPDNIRLGAFNLTTNDLSDPENYARLKQQLRDAAQ